LCDIETHFELFFTQNYFFEGLMNQVDIFSKRLTNITKIRIQGSW